MDTSPSPQNPLGYTGPKTTPKPAQHFTTPTPFVMIKKCSLHQSQKKNFPTPAAMMRPGTENPDFKMLENFWKKDPTPAAGGPAKRESNQKTQRKERTPPSPNTDPVTKLQHTQMLEKPELIANQLEEHSTQ
ncbi:hypothetical protein HNY73_020448 [Argiope bruennichi]|uniref:Uncharacterized protein n=1 Tax=Argiope bruennichi TaxID=94029 RepID=A0A8T0E838_ARGBR|nr:hypothetical protein HNY73_020448 [Argiope bruennichi]